MAILHSCCFWRSVRKGTYASAVYALFYFGSSCVIISIFLHDERKYLSGEVRKPVSDSFLEKDELSSTTVIFNILLLACATCGVICCVLVIIGLRYDKKELLVPWISVMTTDLLIEVSHFTYLVVVQTLDFEPLTATIFTVDFFIMCLNVYCLLCVISQYQEFKAGRGTVNRLNLSRNVRYVPPSASTTTCLNTFRQSRVITSPLMCPHTNFTIIPEETQINGSLGVVHPPTQKHRHLNVMKGKHVQFPDESLQSSKHSPDSSAQALGNKNGKAQMLIETLPEYSETTITWQDQKLNRPDLINGSELLN